MSSPILVYIDRGVILSIGDNERFTTPSHVKTTWQVVDIKGWMLQLDWYDCIEKLNQLSECLFNISTCLPKENKIYLNPNKFFSLRCLLSPSERIEKFMKEAQWHLFRENFFPVRQRNIGCFNFILQKEPLEGECPDSNCVELFDMRDPFSQMAIEQEADSAHISTESLENSLRGEECSVSKYLLIQKIQERARKIESLCSFSNSDCEVVETSYSPTSLP